LVSGFSWDYQYENLREAVVEALTLAALFEMQYVSDPALSSDGRYGAAVVTRIEAGEPPKYASRIHLYDLKTQRERPFTQGIAKDTQPRFNANSTHLAFLSDRHEGKNQLFLMPITGGEAQRLTDFKTGVSEFAWHPDGVQLAFISRGDANEDLKGRGREIERTYYKQDGKGFRPEEIAQIYLLNTQSLEHRPLTELSTNPSSLVFASDGSLLFVAAHNIEDEGYYYRNIWRLNPDSGELKAIIDQPNPLIASNPMPSPDGRYVAYLAPSLKERISSPTGLWLVDSSGGEPSLLTGELDCIPLVGGDSRYGRFPNTPQWWGDSLLVNGNERGSSYVVKVNPQTLERQTLQASQRAVTSFSAVAERVLFTAETPEKPGELYVWEDEQEARLSHATEAFTRRYRLMTPSDEIRLPTTDSESEIVYWTLSPHTPRADYASVLQIHGGPRTNYGYGFSFEMQLMAARGYRVVYGNPRGGSGYGYAFSNSISGRVGTIDAADVLTIARHARQERPEAPMHVTGGSYGGFMTNWLVTQTQEFTSAVTQRSISNWLSFFGTSDIGFSWIHIEVGGNPWEHTERLWDQSPMKHVANVRTPLLILHSEEDYRCPIEQAEQFFTALRVIGKAPVKFVRFPNEGHELSRSGRPDRRLQRLELILDWFERYADGLPG
jgi:dipeptidyl aminopeptidase/acylaminoacyl peptidase